ncbi:hypothetical protein EJB05_13022 [Eragrostis curvula]|uniref:Uncharacterized protein n=1 Tax=Eragrostis curvula TaxID=38414 RepID=A0A5J9VVE3_9POAL|nr:hypothetical protein EJB05_13022 [Eragrostis curvula]
MDPQQPEPVTYLCGDCGAENTLKPGDVIQCRDCGYRILYKKRTRRIINPVPEIIGLACEATWKRALFNMKPAEDKATLTMVCL